ncbi:MAG: hypothetical protein SH817_01570 [Leptospira sp.]|nr:hypothetical protein [Leptospira sp.]
MRNFFFIISISVFFHFCAGGNIKINVKSDLSGELQIFEKRIKTKNTANSLGSGLTPIAETELVIKESHYTFKDITKIIPPGLKFYLYKEEGDEFSNFVIAIDTSQSSPLLRTLNIEKGNISSIVAEAKKRDDLMRFNTLAEHIQFEIFFPFPIKSVSFTEQRIAGDWTARNDGPNKIVINVPMAGMWENEFPLTEVKVKFKE